MVSFCEQRLLKHPASEDLALQMEVPQILQAIPLTFQGELGLLKRQGHSCPAGAGRCHVITMDLQGKQGAESDNWKGDAITIQWAESHLGG